MIGTIMLLYDPKTGMDEQVTVTIFNPEIHELKEEFKNLTPMQKLEAANDLELKLISKQYYVLELDNLDVLSVTTAAELEKYLTVKSVYEVEIK